MWYLLHHNHILDRMRNWECPRDHRWGWYSMADVSQQPHPMWKSHTDASVWAVGSLGAIHCLGQKCTVHGRDGNILLYGWPSGCCSFSLPLITGILLIVIDSIICNAYTSLIHLFNLYTSGRRKCRADSFLTKGIVCNRQFHFKDLLNVTIQTEWIQQYFSAQCSL